MKNSFVILGHALIIFLSFPTFAQEQDVETHFAEKAIRKGNWGLGLSGNMAYETREGLNYHLSSEIQYFFVDKLAVGVVTRYDKNRWYEQTSVGLLATYYFYEMQNSAFFISQAVTWNQVQSHYLTVDKTFWSARTTVGYDYFLNKNVAIGPRLHYDINPMKTWGESNSLGLGIGLSVFF